MHQFKKILLLGLSLGMFLSISNLAPVFTPTASAKTVKTVTIPKKYRHSWHCKFDKNTKLNLTIHKRSAYFAENDGGMTYKIANGAFGKNSYDLYKKNYQGIAIKYVSSHKLHVLIDVTWFTFKR